MWARNIHNTLPQEIAALVRQIAWTMWNDRNLIFVHLSKLPSFHLITKAKGNVTDGSGYQRAGTSEDFPASLDASKSVVQLNHPVDRLHLPISTSWKPTWRLTLHGIAMHFVISQDSPSIACKLPASNVSAICCIQPPALEKCEIEVCIRGRWRL